MVGRFSLEFYDLIIISFLFLFGVFAGFLVVTMLKSLPLSFEYLERLSNGFIYGCSILASLYLFRVLVIQEEFTGPSKYEWLYVVYLAIGLLTKPEKK